MADKIYYCIKENNTCPKRNTCKRYADSDLHDSKTTLFKNMCTEENKRILFIKAEHIDKANNVNLKDGDSTEQTT